MVNDLEPLLKVRWPTFIDLCYDIIVNLPLHSRSFFWLILYRSEPGEHLFFAQYSMSDPRRGCNYCPHVHQTTCPSVPPLTSETVINKAALLYYPSNNNVQQGVNIETTILKLNRQNCPTRYIEIRNQYIKMMPDISHHESKEALK